MLNYLGAVNNLATFVGSVLPPHPPNFRKRKTKPSLLVLECLL